MLTIIILTSIAIIALCIGFFDVRLPFIDRKNQLTGDKRTNDPESARNIEAFYRTLRMENWLHTIEHRRTSDIA